jgi:hypothetical protein
MACQRRSQGRKRREGKNEKNRGSDFSFLPFLPSDQFSEDFSEKPCEQPHGASQIKSGCLPHPFTLQRAAKESALPIPLNTYKVYRTIKKLKTKRQHFFIDSPIFPHKTHKINQKFRKKSL